MIPNIARRARQWQVSRRSFLKFSAGLISAAGATAASPLRFGVVTDVHYADRSPAGTRFYRLGVSKLRACVDLFNQQSADFMMELGDFKDQDAVPAEESALAFLRSIEVTLRGFRGPRYHVLGNHDMDSITKEQFQSVVSNTDIDPARTWYSFDRGGCHFVILDANFRADMTPYSKGNFDWRDANIPPQQVAWLTADLRSAAKPAVIAVHQRLDDGEAEPSIANRGVVRRILEDSGKVALVLQGHVHSGAYQQINGIHYYTLAGSIEGGEPADATCAVVRMGPDVIDITGYRRGVSRKLSPAK